MEEVKARSVKSRTRLAIFVSRNASEGGRIYTVGVDRELARAYN